jgi:hypothetical protein
MWGLDMVGLLRKALKGFTHLLMAIDEFSKWIEARPLAVLGRRRPSSSSLTSSISSGSRTPLSLTIGETSSARTSG